MKLCLSPSESLMFFFAKLVDRFLVVSIVVVLLGSGVRCSKNACRREKSSFGCGRDEAQARGKVERTQAKRRGGGRGDAKRRKHNKGQTLAGRSK